MSAQSSICGFLGTIYGKTSKFYGCPFNFVTKSLHFGSQSLVHQTRSGTQLCDILEVEIVETEAQSIKQELELDGGNCGVVSMESSYSKTTMATPLNVPSTSFPNDKTLIFATGYRQ